MAFAFVGGQKKIQRYASGNIMIEKRKIGVLGAGTWGIALARLLCNAGHDVVVWSAIEKEIDILSTTRKHPNPSPCTRNFNR